VTIRERTIGDITILDIEGRVEVQDGAGAFHDAVRRLISQNHVHVVLNLQFVSYIDSTVVGELAWAYTSLLRRGGKLALVKPTPRVHELLTITHLAQVFEIYSTEDEGVASFGGAA